MSFEQSAIAITAICILVLGIGFLKRKSGMFGIAIIRGVIGMGIISFVNKGMLSMQIPYGIGLNLCTFLTSGILGFPGIILLYGIRFFFSL